MDKQSINYAYLPDFKLMYSEEDLDRLSQELSEEDEKIFKEILELERQHDGKTDLMEELLEAAKDGAMQYLNAMTDTGETFNRMKDPKSVQDLNDEKVIKQAHSADPNEKRKARTLGEARYEVFDKNVSGTTLGVSEEGTKLFARHKEAYSQRTKSVTGISKEGSSLHYKKNEKSNFESLAGLRGYRIGAVVPMYSVEEIQEMHAQKRAEQGTLDNTSTIHRKNGFTDIGSVSSRNKKYTTFRLKV